MKMRTVENIVAFQGLREIGSTPWASMLEIPEVCGAVVHMERTFEERKLTLEGRRVDLIDYARNGAGWLEDHTSTVFEHCFIYAASVGILEAEQPQYDATLGFSCGEYTAAYAAGCISLSEGEVLAFTRGEAIARVSMKILKVAVKDPNHPENQTFSLLLMGEKLPVKHVRALCKSVRGIKPRQIRGHKDRGVWLGNINGYGQGIVTGDPTTIAKMRRRLMEKPTWRLRIKDIDLAAPVHTPLLNTSKQEFAQTLKGIEFQEPRVPIIPNATGRLETDPEHIKQLLLRQITARLNFRTTMKQLPQNAEIYEICLPFGRVIVSSLITREQKMRRRMEAIRRKVFA